MEKDTAGAASRPRDEDRKPMDVREANENIRKAQGDEQTDTPVDPKKTGNRPRFDRDR